MDETGKQRIEDIAPPLLLEVEPLTGWVHVEAHPRCTRIDWAHWGRGTQEERYLKAEKVILMADYLHTPKHGSWLYSAES